MTELTCEISASSWFYYKEIYCHDARSHVTMHGHMNVKFATIYVHYFIINLGQKCYYTKND